MIPTPMKTEQESISKMLSVIEGVIDNHDNYRDVFSDDDLEDYCIAALLASKNHGRKYHRVNQVVNDLEGLSIGVLGAAGLDYDAMRKY